MLYDLNIPWSPSTPSSDLARTLSFSKSLGYDVVALNQHITPSAGTPPPPLPSIPSSSPKLLRRATFTLSDPSLSLRASSLLAHYDILAVRPTTAPAFQTACVALQDVSLISLNLASHLGFPLRPRPVMAAVSRGVRFEVSYAQFFTGSDDARSRANFISNLSNLVRATGGRGIVVSSGADPMALGPGGLRAPADVVNLLAVWGLAQERGRQGLGSVPRGVVVNEAIKRSGFRGVVDVVGVAEESGKRKREDNEEKGEEDKRDEKGGEKKDGVSKRQAKKMRLAERGADRQ